MVATTTPRPCLSPCPIERGMRIIGGKWKGSILWHLRDEPMRFGALARALQGASRKMVSQRLQDQNFNHAASPVTCFCRCQKACKESCRLMDRPILLIFPIPGDEDSGQRDVFELMQIT